MHTIFSTILLFLMFSLGGCTATAQNRAIQASAACARRGDYECAQHWQNRATKVQAQTAQTFWLSNSLRHY